MVRRHSIYGLVVSNSADSVNPIKLCRITLYHSCLHVLKYQGRYSRKVHNTLGYLLLFIAKGSVKEFRARLYKYLINYKVFYTGANGLIAIDFDDNNTRFNAAARAILSITSATAIIITTSILPILMELNDSSSSEEEDSENDKQLQL